MALDAAKQLLSSGCDFGKFTVDTIASRADLSRQTVYHHFRSKRGILESLFDSIGQDSGLVDGIFRFLSETDVDQAVELFVKTFCQFWGTNRTIISKLMALSELDPDLSEALYERKSRRRHAVAVLSDKITKDRGTGNFKTQEEMGDAIWALTGFESFCELLDKGLDQNAATERVISILKASLPQVN